MSEQDTLRDLSESREWVTFLGANARRRLADCLYYAGLNPGVRDEGPFESDAFIVNAIEGFGREPFVRRAMILRTNNLGKKSYAEIVALLEHLGRAELLITPPVQRCPHCDQPLPKAMR